MTEKLVKESVTRVRRRLKLKCITIFCRNYSPWLEESSYLKVYGVQFFQELIVQFSLEVEIGRVQILLDMPLLSSYIDMLCIGHLEKVLHIFVYLKSHPKIKLGFDLAHNTIHEKHFQEYD